MNITSLTIGGTEWITKLVDDGTSFSAEVGGNISTATFVLRDISANINGITGRPEVIAYIGDEKVWGGYAAVYSKSELTPGMLQLTLRCQDYMVLMDRAVTTAEHVFTGTDDAAIDTLFSTYCSAISTTPVNQVISNLQGLAVKVGTTVRKALDMIRERSGAESYVTPDKALEYFDPASDAPTCPFWLRESPTVLYDGDLSTGGWTAGSVGTFTASTGTLIEDSDTSEHYVSTVSIGSTVDTERYVFAVDVKPNGRTWIALGAQGNSWHKAYFDIANVALGTVHATHTARVFELGDGWVRCEVGFTATSVAAGFTCYLATANGTINYAGDGSSGIYIRAAYIATGRPIHRDDFSHDTDVAILANDVTVRAGADGTETIDIPCEGTASDGHVSKEDPYNWPPTGTVTPDSSSGVIYLRVGHDGATYYRVIPLMKFDTSVIPSGATVLGAQLGVYVSGTPVAASGDGIGIEYYDDSNWPISTGDYSDTPGNSAYGFTNPTINGYAINLFELTDPDSNLDKSGETGLRMNYKFTGTPASDIITMSFYGVETGSHGPFLRVTYTAPAVQANDTDATSITAYDRQKVTIVDSSVESDAEAALRVAVELAKRKSPQEYGVLKTDAPGVQVGDLVHIVSDQYDVDDEFLVRSIETSWESGSVVYRIEYGDSRPNYVRLLRQLNALRVTE